MILVLTESQLPENDMEHGYYSSIKTPCEAIYEAACAMDNQDVPLEEWPAKLIAALNRSGFAVVSIEMPPAVLGHEELTMEINIRIQQLIAEHGGVRTAARSIGLSPSYLIRLRDGEKVAPSKNVLLKLGLRKVSTYARVESLT